MAAAGKEECGGGGDLLALVLVLRAVLLLKMGF